jgi:hypothetical protein
LRTNPDHWVIFIESSANVAVSAAVVAVAAA